MNKKKNRRTVVKKQKQKIQNENKTSFKSINKKRNLKVQSKVGEATHTVAKELRKRGKNNAEHVSVNLLNSSIVKLVRHPTAESNVKNKKTVPNKTPSTKQGSNNNLQKGKKENNVQSQKKIGTAAVKNRTRSFNNVKSVQQKQNDKVKGKLGNKAKQLKSKEDTKDNVENKRHSRSKVIQSTSENSQKITQKPKLNIKRLEEMLAVKRMGLRSHKKCEKPSVPLRDRMMAKLKASRFRYINETLYNNESSSSKKYFKDDPDAFTAYHDGYKQQIDQWPLNPLDEIISSIKKMPKDYVIADFGCGEGRLATSVSQKVHSFDFVSLNDRVTACDMAHTPLLTSGVNVVVFCLSLMGTNLNDYIIEANRVLKKDGILKIAEVESRFDKVDEFIKCLGDYGFKNTWKDLSHNLFYFLDFKKVKDITGKKNKLPPITLKACLYKKR